MNPPDLPPAIPPLPPPLPRPPSMPPPPIGKGMSTGMIVLIVVGVMVLSVALIVAVAVFTFHHVQASASEIRQKHSQAVEPLGPLTTEQKKAFDEFGIKLADALTRNDGEQVTSMLDAEGLADRVFDDSMADALQVGEMKRSLVSGVMKTKGGWMKKLLGMKSRVLRQHERGGRPALTVRMHPQDGGVNYVDFIATPDGRGGFHLVDVFNFIYASYLSDETRNLMITMLPDSSAGPLAKWSGIDMEMLNRLKTMGQSMSTNDYAETLRIYDSLPDKYRKHRMFFILRLQALMALHSSKNREYTAAYKAVLQAAPDILGRESTTDLLMLDLFLMEGQLKEADECIQHMEKIIGGDAYLKVMRANIRRKWKDFDGALKLVKEAQQDEPDLYDAVDACLTIYLEKNNFQAMVEELRSFEANSGQVLGRKELSKKTKFKEFLASPEFAEWEKRALAP